MRNDGSNNCLTKIQPKKINKGNNEILPNPIIISHRELIEAKGIYIINPSGDLLFHIRKDAVSSALKGLTSRFGMVLGVSPLLFPLGLILYT